MVSIERFRALLPGIHESPILAAPLNREIRWSIQRDGKSTFLIADVLVDPDAPDGAILDPRFALRQRHWEAPMLIRDDETDYAISCAIIEMTKAIQDKIGAAS